MYTTSAATLLLLVLGVVLSSEDDGLTPSQVGVEIPFSTSCELKLVSSSQSWTDTFDGDIYFLDGNKQLLLIGLHPEWSGGALAIKNELFKRGKNQWDFQWVNVDFPARSENRQREYKITFSPKELMISCQGQSLINIPYNELANDKEEFLSNIDVIKFDSKNIDLKFAKLCSGSVQAVPKLIVYDSSNQKGTTKTLHGPTPRFDTIDFNDRVDSVWAVHGDWELYTGYDYRLDRFFVEDGQKINARNVNQYSSARPANCRYISDPTTAKLRVSSSSHFQYGMQEYLTPQKDLGDYKNKITSVIADKGDWELYSRTGYQGSRLVVTEGQQIEHLGGYDNDIESLRPLCETYKGKEKCALQRVEIIDEDAKLEPRYTGTEVIGSQSSGSCYGPASHEISITQINGVEESISLEVSREDEVNWAVTASVEVEASAKFLGSGTSVTMGMSLGAGGAVVLGSSETKETMTMNEKEHGQVTEFAVPGAGILFGIVDRYEIDQSKVPVKMHMSCPDGQNKTVDSTMALKKVSFGAAHFWSLTGQFTKEACKKDRGLPECVENVRKNFANFVGQRAAIEDAFEKCFADGKGEFKRV